MSFTDKDNVQSLLAFLKEHQDGFAVGAATGAGKNPGSAADRPPPATAPAAPEASASLPTQPNSALSDLLAQLDDEPPRSAFDGPKKGFMQPFGPITGVSSTSTERRPSAASSAAAAAPPTSQDKGKRKLDDTISKADWSFSKCLPVLTDLLRDDEFVKELKRMKAEQDSLERRLWARMEKVKADHQAKTKPEREIARITRKPITQEKQNTWNRQLKQALNEQYRGHVMVSVDGLAARHRARLVELGVPGLGEGKTYVKGGIKTKADREAALKEKERVRRIMAVLEGALEDT